MKGRFFQLTFTLQDTLEFVGWELIGVVCQAFVYGTDVSAIEECRKVLEVIALVSETLEVYGVIFPIRPCLKAGRVT